MAFREFNPLHLARFNSSASSELLSVYETFVDAQIAADVAELPHRTFAPSSFRCDRKSWFRLRGTQPDAAPTPDRELDWISKMGTACHRVIQNNLIRALGNSWIPVDKYLATVQIPYQYKLTPAEDSSETYVEIVDPPIRFACDGIIWLQGEYWLFEIKSLDHGTWNDLTDPLDEHADQVKCYATYLNLSKVLFMYVDRQYGTIKCYQVTILSTHKAEILQRVDNVMKMVEMNLAPKGLPKGDKWCTPSYCPYYKKCAEYGR